MTLIDLWETQKHIFDKLEKTQFDQLYREEHFADGPLTEMHSKFMREFGPYSPERWAFGKLKDGRFICTKVVPIDHD